MKWALLALACLGCGSPLDVPVSTVWKGVYGETSAPPVVVLVNGRYCVDGRAGIDDDGQCVAGLYYSNSDFVEVEQIEPLSDSALAHELEHAAQWRHGVLDYQHQAPEWSTVVPAANDLLRSEGY